MTNFQCYCYSAKAISNILKETDKVKLTSDVFYGELHYLWDVYSEDAIEELVRKEEENSKLF